MATKNDKSGVLNEGTHKLVEKILVFYEKNGVDVLQIEAGDISVNIGNGSCLKSSGVKSIFENMGEIVVPQNRIEDKDSAAQILAPMVGTFYSTPEPGKPNYVKVGDSVKKGDVVGLLEAMKSFNELKADEEGIIEEILVTNGQMVEHGQPLIRLSIPNGV